MYIFDTVVNTYKNTCYLGTFSWSSSYINDYSYCYVLKATKQFLMKVVKSNKGIKLNLPTLKSLRELLQFKPTDNILVHFK